MASDLTQHKSLNPEVAGNVLYNLVSCYLSNTISYHPPHVHSIQSPISFLHQAQSHPKDFLLDFPLAQYILTVDICMAPSTGTFSSWQNEVITGIPTGNLRLPFPNFCLCSTYDHQTDMLDLFCVLSLEKGF